MRWFCILQHGNDKASSVYIGSANKYQFLGEITMRVKYILFILLLISTCGLVGAGEGEELVSSAEAAKESVREAVAEMGNTFDAAKEAVAATPNTLSETWNTAKDAFASIQAALEPFLASVNELIPGSDNTSENNEI